MPIISAAKTPAQAWADLQTQVAPSLRAAIQNQRGLATTVGLTSAQILSFEARLRGYVTLMDAVSNTPGIVAYVTSLPNLAGYDVASDFAALKTQVVASAKWIRDNFPKDGSATGYLLAQSFAADGSGLVDRVFSVATLTGQGFVAGLDTLLALLGNAIPS